MKVGEAIEKLEKVEEKDPDATIFVDPPFHAARGIYYRGDEGVVEISH